MSQFYFPRFQRVIQNDALRHAKPLFFGTLALLGLTVLIYLGKFNAGQSENLPVHVVLFPIYLLATGLLFTSMSFQDMHHPLERYQYLMLPCSNIERFLSRYLLTGPLFLLYVMATFTAMDWVANQVTEMWKDAQAPLFSPFSAESLQIARIYLLLHIAMLTGAICSRSYALLKTALSVLLLIMGLGVVSYIATRIFYWDAFSWTSWAPSGASAESFHMPLEPLFVASWMNFTVVIGFVLWILYVAYRCLCTHEVQDGI
jgi:hypothetical protein